MTNPIPLSDRAPSASHSMRAGRSAERSPAQLSPEQKRSAQPEPFNSFTPMGAHIDALLAKVKP